MRVPLPTVGYEAGPAAPPARAPGIEPFQDQRGRQLQALGGGIADAGLALSKIQDFQQDRIDTATAVEQANALDDVLRGDELEFQQLTGKAAAERHQEFGERVKKRRQDAAQSLQNDTQRLIFDQRTEGTERQTLGSIDAHYLRQSRAWEIGVISATIENRIATAVRSVDDPVQYALAKGAAEAETRKLAARQGFEPGDEAEAAMLSDTRDKIHSSIVLAMAEQDPVKADAYLKANEEEVAPAMLDQLRRSVRIAQDRQAAGIKAAEEEQQAMVLTNQISDAGVPLLQQRQMLRKVFESGAAPAGVIEKSWAQLQNLHLNQRRAEEDAEKALTAQWEQQLGNDLTISYDTLPEPVRKEVEKLGLGAKAREIESRVRARQLNDRLRNEKDLTNLDIEHDLKNLRTLDELILYIDPKSPEGKASFATLSEAQKLKQAEMAQNLIVLRDALKSQQPVEAPVIAPKPAATPEEKAQRFRETVRDALKGIYR